MLDVVSSLSATMVAELFTLPICTIKSVYLTNLSHRSAVDSVKSIMTTRGLRGFYDSSYPAVISQLTSTTTKYSSYEMIKRLRQTESTDMIASVTNGVIGGAFSSFFTHPIDFWKVHKQNGLSCRSQMLLKGSSILYRGFSYTLQKNMMLTGIIFPSYDFIRGRLSKSDTISVQLAPIISSFFTTLLIHPLDVRKTRGIMGNHALPTFEKQSPVRSSLRSLSYFYRGIHLSFLRTIPHFSLTMWCIEFFKSLLENRTKL